MGSTTPADAQYHVLRIPTTSPRLADLVTKFRDTKLAALQTSPSEWIYQYVSEAKHPLSVWESRLARQNTILICVATSAPFLSAGDALIQAEWVGFAAARGPLSYMEYYAVPEMEQPIPENPDAESRWHMYDLYTSPAHRGREIASKLGAACMATVSEITASLKSDTGGVQRSRIRLIVNPKNTVLVETYKRLGFQTSGRVTLREGFQANGMGESIPAEDTMSAENFKRVFDTRIGMAMERIIDV
ncbi:uncharacterized protein K460DRAFT_368245 [Cucurbitaria berberidis CBS 394.84]|uniref:N-acetyltransferase domain-containing protein n=1 Tax=Cucurbitaria berberidis CBS 394.84 TaxID=1168544 RepID=A0A9P4GD72_9PLEO|nr:uncharacterized protein K460DRAFT_368245 [Cucurbitaria berberidis CBS 394.84]KAF1843344.1 hypothetical protein K460DRAFT_368245 [Cucurbitaria berberidis CBS 394.84]